jgi:hypothetical protein
MATVSALDLIKDALMEIGVYSQGETPSAADAQFGLTKFNRMMDAWNAKKLNVYNVDFNSYTLVPSLQPHTIGPTGATFTVAQRPVKIENAAIILTSSSPSVRCPMNIRNDDWWANLRVRDILTTLPTDLYYSPAWPNGNLFLWPIPTAAFGIELETWTLLSQIANLTTTINLPPGYQDAITYELALSMCPAFAKQPDALLLEAWKHAKAIIQAVNSTAPLMTTRDFGMPKAGPEKPYFNYLTGGFTR